MVIVSGKDLTGAPFGFTASTLSVVSCAPPLVSISVARDSTRVAELRRCACFALSVLSESQADIAKRFGTPGTPRFNDSCSDTTEAGPPVVSGATLHMICELEAMVPAGDHFLFIASVSRLAMPGGKPLVYWRRAFFRVHLEYPFLASGEALHEFIRDWESCDLHLTAWTHAAHIAVTAYYAFDRSPEELFRTMKEGITKFNTSAGVDNGPDTGYHESLTRFWSNIISSLISGRRFASPFEAACEAVENFGEERDLHNLYYSFNVVRSPQARREWIPPDRAPSVRWFLPAQGWHV